MYFDAQITVTIGGKLLTTINSVHVKNDSKEIGSSCKIVVPLACRIEYNDGGSLYYLTDLTKNLFKSGDPVVVTAFYRDELGIAMPTVSVFNGFVYEFIEGTPMVIECMDNIYLLNQVTVNLAYKTTTLRQVLTDVLDAANAKNNSQLSLGLPTLELTLEKLTFRLMSPASVLEWLKKELGLNISLNGSVLYCNIASNTVQQAFLDTTRNVITSHLQKPEAVYLKLKLKAWFILENGKKSSLEVGEEGGELREVFFYRIPFNVARYTQLAGEALIKYKQMKFSGMIETYLYPEMGLFWKVQYLDKRYPDRNGNYTVVGMDFSLDANGFHRHIRLAYLSDIDSDVDALSADNALINLQP